MTLSCLERLGTIVRAWFQKWAFTWPERTIARVANSSVEDSSPEVCSGVRVNRSAGLHAESEQG